MFGKDKNPMKSARETLREKMIKHGPHVVIEVTGPELSIVLSEEFPDLMKEVEEIVHHRTVQPEIEKKLEAMRDHPENGLTAMAGINGEPDHKAHLEVQETPRRVPTFEEAVKPLMAWLADNHCPHSHVVVSGVSAELFHAVKRFNSFEFVKD